MTEIDEAQLLKLVTETTTALAPFNFQVKYRHHYCLALLCYGVIVDIFLLKYQLFHGKLLM